MNPYNMYRSMEKDIQMAGSRWIVFLFIFCFINPLAAAEHVVVQLKWVNQFQFAGYYAALEKGFYKAAGFDVELRPNGYDGAFVSPVDAVVSGKAQYGISNSGLVLDYLNGKPVVALAATLQHSAVSWLVLEKSEIRNIHDMANKRLMTVFPLSESLELLEPFRAEGIAPEKLNLIQTVFDLQPLIDGKVDAYDGYVTNEPFLLEQKGIAYRLIDPRTYGIDFYGDVLFTSQNELRDHPERVAAFRKASMDGWRYAMAHPEEIIDLILSKYAPQKTHEHLRFEAKTMWNLMQPDIIEIGHMNPRRWLHIAEVMVEHKRLIDDKVLNPFIYNGEEIGMSNVDYQKLEDFKDVSALNYANDARKRRTPEEILHFLRRTSRINARTPMQWSAETFAGFSTVEPLTKVNGNYQVVNVQSQEGDPNSILNYYRKAIALRKNPQILDLVLDGHFDLLDLDNEDVFAYVHQGNPRLVVIANFRKEIVTYFYPYGDEKNQIVLANYIDRKEVTSPLKLRPFEALVMLIKSES
ncbi:MAG: hypothetical protein EOM46_14290 [Gammaproteobacteria bacterium]|nr:hypothetical protein [Gammaproteobacteria bacterium]